MSTVRERRQTTRQAPFALRVVQRRGGNAAIIYRRVADERGRDRLKKVAAISSLALGAGTPLLREATKAAGDARPLAPGRFRPLDADWGARVACYALIAAGLRDADRLMRAAATLRHTEGTDAAWWLGLITRNHSNRALRALRILTEAAQ